MDLRIKKLQDVHGVNDEKKKRAQDSRDRKQKATETLPEAWERIFSQKNDDATLRRLREVKQAMDEGRIGRNPDDMVTKKGTPKRFSKAEALRLYAEIQERRRKRILEEMRENVPDNYVLIQTEKALDDFLAGIASEGFLPFDIETTGTDVWNDKIVGIVLSLPNADRHCYIPTNHKTDEPQLDRDYVLKRIEPYLNDPDLPKIAHNGKFDIHMLASHGIKFSNLAWDTQTAMQILNENEPSKRLKDLATKYLDMPSHTYGYLFGKVGFDEVSDLRLALAYAAKDGELTIKLRDFQRSHMQRVDLIDYYEKVEAPLHEVVVKMERAGFVIDLDAVRRIGAQLEAEIDGHLERMRDLFGVDEEFNFASVPQLSGLLFDRLKLHRKLPKGMKKSTNAKALKSLAPHHEGVAELLEYRAKTKLYGTYIKGAEERIVEKTGRLHGEFMQDSTVTGRFSSKNPNLQNQPGYVRQIYKAPPGMILLSGDFSQQEPRLLAHFSQEPTLLEAYRAGKDLYSTAASEVFEKPIEECGDGSKYRKMMKTGILAVMYGTGEKTLAGQLGISVMEAKAFIADFYRKYPRVAAWVEGNKEFLRQNGFVRMLYGRKRRIPEIKSGDEWKVFRAERQATNAIIQGSAAIQTKLTMLELDAWLESFDDDRTIALQVHDEVGAYVPEDIPPEQVKAFEQIMLGAVTLDVPNKSDIEGAYVWGSGVDWDSENMCWYFGHGGFRYDFETPVEALRMKGELSE